MKAKKVGSYRNEKGTLVFRHEVSGTPEELAAYKKAQGEFYRESEDERKVPMWFSSRFYGNTVKLGISQKSGQVFADTSEFDAAASLANQFTGNLGTAIANQLAAKILGNLGGNTVAAEAPVEAASAEGLDKI